MKGNQAEFTRGARVAQGEEVTGRRDQEGVINPQDFKFRLYLCDGEVQEIGPATGLRLTPKELVFLLGDLVVARVPRQGVYCVARQEAGVPVLF